METMDVAPISCAGKNLRIKGITGHGFCILALHVQFPTAQSFGPYFCTRAEQAQCKLLCLRPNQSLLALLFALPNHLHDSLCMAMPDYAQLLSKLHAC
jgi:hypothetical protein